MNDDLNLSLQEAYKKLNIERQLLQELKITDLDVFIKYDLKTDKEKLQLHFALDFLKKKIEQSTDDWNKSKMEKSYKDMISFNCHVLIKQI